MTEPQPSSAEAFAEWRRAHRAFEEIVALPPDQRTKRLQEVAAGNARLRKQLESLLAAYEELESGGTGAEFLRGLDADRARGLLDAAYAESGWTVGRYRILHELGRGGMGVVYLAHDPQLKRDLALKLLSPHLSLDQDAKRRFIEEARAASALDHPNIATIYEINETEDGRVFIAMASYAGETLKERIARGPLPASEAASIMAQIAAGLAAAHGRGIVHRDIKPANVILTPERMVKIVDFGVAKVLGRSLTRTGATIGTAAYMSPEQTRSADVDHRTDLWSLGVVAYEMLTARRPFEADHEQGLIYAIRNDEPAELTGAGLDAPPELIGAIHRCLDKDPDTRCPDAARLLQELQPLVGPDLAYSPPKRARHPGRRRRIAGMAAAAIATLALAATTVYLAQRGSSARIRPDDPTAVQSEKVAPAGVAASAASTRLAVLPFDDLGDDPEAEYLAEGVTEELISRLSRLEDLRLIARSSIVRFKDVDWSVAQVGRELNVGRLVTGSVRLRGSRARIAIELIDAGTEEQLWADVFEVETANVLAVQGEIAEQVASALEAGVDPASRERLRERGTQNSEAYLQYLRGRYYWNQRTPDGIMRARDHFQDAIDIDPAFARAWAGLADVYVLFGSYGMLKPAEAFPTARAAVERALEIDDDLPEAHASRAAVLRDYYWEWTRAEQEYQRSIELDPSYATAFYWYSEFVAYLGRTDQAIELARRARELDPFSLLAIADIGRAHYLARRYDEAIEYLRKTLDRGPHVVAYIYLSLAYLQSGSPMEAIATIEEGGRRFPGVSAMRAILGYAYGRSDAETQARRIAEELIELRNERYVPAFEIAAVFLGMGEPESALDWLEQTYEERDPTIFFLPQEPILDPLRSNARFQALLEGLALPE